MEKNQRFRRAAFWDATLEKPRTEGVWVGAFLLRLKKAFHTREKDTVSVMPPACCTSNAKEGERKKEEVILNGTSANGPLKKLAVGVRFHRDAEQRKKL